MKLSVTNIKEFASYLRREEKSKKGKKFWRYWKKVLLKTSMTKTA